MEALGISMHFALITLFPEMVETMTGFGVTGRAIQQGQVGFDLINPRDYALDAYRRVDDRPYGGGPGMLLMAEPLSQAIKAAKRVFSDKQAHVVYLSPQGKQINQHRLKTLMERRHLILISGRYEGIDERVIESDVDEEISIADIVLSGGEMAAMALVDAMIRQLPGVLGDEASAVEDSFENGLLDYPHYTRPEVFESQSVPSVLLSGDHKAIATWRLKQALGRTWLRRPDLLHARGLSEEETRLLNEFKEEYQN